VSQAFPRRSLSSGLSEEEGEHAGVDMQKRRLGIREGWEITVRG
jgi:hypothetical protein